MKSLTEFRENHGLHPIIIPTITGDWTFKILRVLSKKDYDYLSGRVPEPPEQPPYKNVHAYDYSTHDKALEVALKEMLKMINQ